MRFTHEAQVMPSMGRMISIGWGAAGWDVILGGSITPLPGVSCHGTSRFGQACHPSHVSGSTRGRESQTSPPRSAISGGSGWDRKNGIDSVAP